MADEVENQGETPEAPAPETETIKGEPFDAARAMATITKQRDELKAAKAAAKELEAYKKAEADRLAADMSELDKLKAKVVEAETKAARLERESLQRKAADAAGLPAAFASRLQGESLEAMTEDATALLAAMPKADKTAPKLSPGNPGPAAPAKETEAQKRERLFGRQVNPFSDDVLLAKGGGVIWDNNKG